MIATIATMARIIPATRPIMRKVRDMYDSFE
jgi:hypothetical protein